MKHDSDCNTVLKASPKPIENLSKGISHKLLSLP